jgi:hypothetical protein
MKRLLGLALCLSLVSPLVVQAAGKLKSEQSVDIKASPDKVWALVKDFDALPKWHPAFKNDVIKSGTNDTKGAIRTLTLGSGESFDEELLDFNDKKKMFRYRIVGDSPFPLTDYVSSMRVTKGKDGGSKLTWIGKFKGKPGSGKTDAEVVEIINGAYKAGLDNVKKLAEQG